MRLHATPPRAQGDTLRTEELVWNNETREIVTDKPVRIATRTFRLSGKGLRVKVDSQQFWLQTKVKADLMPVAMKNWRFTENRK